MLPIGRKTEGKKIQYDWKGAYWQDWWGRKHYYYDSTEEGEKKEEEEDQEQAPAAGALGTGQPEWQPAFPTNYVPVNAGAGKTNNAISSSPAVYPPAADDDIPQTASPTLFLMFPKGSSGT